MGFAEMGGNCTHQGGAGMPKCVNVPRKENGSLKFEMLINTCVLKCLQHGSTVVQPRTADAWREAQVIES